MAKEKYTLDRIDDGIYVFLNKMDESKEMLIPLHQVQQTVNEGDIVEISTGADGIIINVLAQETNEMKDKVSSLLDKLRQKK